MATDKIDPHPGGDNAATFIELRAHINRAQRAAEHLAAEAPEPQRHGFDGIVTLLSNAHRILGEISEASTVSTVERAQADLDQLRLWNARKSALNANATYIELTLEQTRTLERDGIESDLVRVAVLAEAAARADERRCPCHVICADGSVLEIVQPSQLDGGS